MTFPEYLYRMKAYNLSKIDKEYDMHLQAWINREINMKKQQGKNTVYVYKEFKDFFDYEKRLNEIEREKEESNLTEHERSLAHIASSLNKKGG